MTKGCVRIKYTGAEASCLLKADSTAKTLSSKIGNLGAEAADNNFGAAGIIDLTAAAYDTLAELKSAVDSYADYDAEIFFGDNSFDTSSIMDSETQAKDIWVYELFEVESVLNTENALISWALAKEMLAYDNDQQNFIERIINAVSRRGNMKSDRLLKTRSYIKILDGTGTDTLILPQYPINIITHLYLDAERVFGSETEITDTEYGLYEDSGKIQLYEQTFPDEIKSVKSEFNAGFGYGSEDIPEDLQFAALESVEWNAKRFRGKGIGIRSESSPDGVNITMEITIPANAQRVFESYRRPE